MYRPHAGHEWGHNTWASCKRLSLGHKETAPILGVMCTSAQSPVVWGDMSLALLPLTRRPLRGVREGVQGSRCCRAERGTGTNSPPQRSREKTSLQHTVGWESPGQGVALPLFSVSQENYPQSNAVAAGILGPGLSEEGFWGS